MYQIKSVNEIYRANPWQIPYYERMDGLKRSKKAERKTVAFLYPQFDSSTFRYRGYNITETLEYSLRWGGAYFERKDIAVLMNDLKYIDVLVMIRCAWEIELDILINKAKQQGTKICYDVDDLIYSPKYMPTVINTLGLERGAEWDFWFGLTARNWLIINKCDATITTNVFLAKYLESDINKPCYIIKNYLNWIQESVSTEYFNQKQNIHSEKMFEIGYFSGSPTHMNDVMVIMPEMEEFLNKYRNSIFKIVGYAMNFPQEYQYLIETGRIQFVPFQTFVGLQYEQAKVDINVVPLVNNEFSNCKSELKYFENAIVGTITCATPSFTYSKAIENGDNGYLCEKGEWLPAFEKIYEQGVQYEQQRYIREEALKSYSFINQLADIELVLDNIIKQR